MFGRLYTNYQQHSLFLIVRLENSKLFLSHQSRNQSSLLFGDTLLHYATKLWKGDRKSTRLNSSHVSISYAVFCLKKKIMGIPKHHCCRQTRSTAHETADTC